jgi:hypothetical protein
MAKTRATVVSRQSAEELSGTVGHEVPTPRSTHPATDDYLILLINCSNLVITRGCYDFNPNGPNNWFVLPTTSRNCPSGNCDTCAENEQWTPILNVNCNESINLTIATNPDNSGKVYGATFAITPNCSYSGGAICIT